MCVWMCIYMHVYFFNSQGLSGSKPVGSRQTSDPREWEAVHCPHMLQTLAVSWKTHVVALWAPCVCHGGWDQPPQHTMAHLWSIG